jgi:hypothetical protein
MLYYTIDPLNFLNFISTLLKFTKYTPSDFEAMQKAQLDKARNVIINQWGDDVEQVRIAKRKLERSDDNNG